jgi:hypothetical protein
MLGLTQWQPSEVTLVIGKLHCPLISPDYIWGPLIILLKQKLFSGVGADVFASAHWAGCVNKN